MKEKITALGFYQNPKTAFQVLSKLNKAGIKRTALIQRFEGQFNIHFPYPNKLWIGLSLFFLICLIFTIATQGLEFYLNIFLAAATLLSAFLFFAELYLYRIP